MAKNWDKSETNYLTRYSTTKTLVELGQRFKASPDEVRRKLIELKVDSKDGGAGVIGPDPATEVFEEGVKALYRKSWKKALGVFEKVIEESESPDLIDRARQFAHLCRSRSADEGDAQDPYLQAVYHKNRGELNEALAIVQDKKHAKDERFVYLEASLLALAGRTDDAVQSLERSIAMNSENRVHAFHDRDFEALRENSDLDHVFGLE